jgi:lysozyme
MIADAPAPSIDNFYARNAKTLQIFEGFRPAPYKCPAGYLTIGYGHRIREGESFPEPYPHEAAYYLLLTDIRDAHSACRRLFYPSYDSFPAPAKDALIQMVFQLGEKGASKFKNLRHAIAQTPPDWVRAGKECLDSRWAAQTPTRAKHCATLFFSLVQTTSDKICHNK